MCLYNARVTPMKKKSTKKPKGRGRVKVAVYLEQAQKEQLDALSERTRVPWAEYVREGVEEVLARYRKQQKQP